MLKGNILKELIEPAVKGKSSGERNGAVKIPFRFMEEMEKSIKGIADVTRTDNPFEEKRKGNVIRRRQMAIV